MTTHTNDEAERAREGHWDTAAGEDMARAYATKTRTDLCKGDVSDMALANAVFMADGNDLDLIVWQTAAKERIRWLSARLAFAKQEGEKASTGRPYPNLLSTEEDKALLEAAERIWRELQEDRLGGYSGINRPFWIHAEFKDIIEKFGRRDVGQTWTKDQLDAATPDPVASQSGGALREAMSATAKELLLSYEHRNGGYDLTIGVLRYVAALTQPSATAADRFDGFAAKATDTRSTEGAEQGLGPHATVLEHGADGFMAVAVLCGELAYIQQGESQITMSLDVADRLVATLASTPPPPDQSAQERIVVLEAALNLSALAIEMALETSDDVIEWAEPIRKSKRGHEDDDDHRQERKSALYTSLDDARRRARTALGKEAS